MPDERIVLVCAEAHGLSWPNLRRTRAGCECQDCADGGRVATTVWNDDTKVTLTGHSGGGSFMFGVIEASDEIPNYIDRIAFLDANYSFDAALHAAKLERWLNGDDIAAADRAGL